ncbi:MAG: deoxyribodipyrimidine photo-lyase [Acidaminococcaceae bacterium]
MKTERIRKLKDGVARTGPIVYWMSRDQRAEDNWALTFAQKLALEKSESLAVVFCLTPNFAGATWRQYDFMLKGLAETSAYLHTKNIPFFLLIGDPATELIRCVKENTVQTIITDFDPLTIKQQWKQNALHELDIPVYEVDSHNIVPCWRASPKQEYGAYTLRPKVRRVLASYLDSFIPLQYHPINWPRPVPFFDWQKALGALPVDRRVAPVQWMQPGGQAACQQLDYFINYHLTDYGTLSNDPGKDCQSNLSPYLHFGQLAPQRVALTILQKGIPGSSQEAFLEELIIRRELADNFCYYNPNYQKVDGFPTWAQQTLEHHLYDERPYLYSLEQLEKAETHDPFWNAAQLEMMKRGKMHGYLRMYWAKKILEWTASPKTALETAIHLNDRYLLDGRDPNGYAGIAWSIGGVHDRAWGERPIFGKIRYMSGSRLALKFNMKKYLERVSQL